jgi:type IX secretion system PorP/SprF family membrane protein
MKKFYIFIVLCLASITALNAQDVQFSQFYANQIYLSPAFAGGSHAPRGVFHQRLQWPGADAKYITSFFSFDNFVQKYNSGYGVYVMQDFLGSNNINQTEINAQYAYELHLGRNATFRAGFQAGFITRAVNFGGLRFTDFHNDVSGYDGTVIDGTDRIYLPTVGTGGLFYSKNFWFGFSGKHLNRPFERFVGAGERWPALFTFVTGYKIPLKHPKHMAYLEDEKDISITPTIHYKFQGKADQLDLGFYGTYDQLIAGFWYRGIPFKVYQKGLHNNESIVLLGGWRYKNYTFGYSYDIVVGKIYTARTRGAHELILTYTHHKHQKQRKPMRRIPCPSIDKNVTYF